jgi:methylmalonyl-CoA mutase
MSGTKLQLGEPADEADWRALVEQGLKGARWERLVGQTSDGIAIEPLYREPDLHTATDVSGFPGAAPFIRGAREGAWRVRQAYEHPDIEQTNRAILADLAGGVGAIELVVDPEGERGIAIRDARDLDRVLAGVILEAAPVSLDPGAFGPFAASFFYSKLKGVAAPGTAFNVDPIGVLMRTGKIEHDAVIDAVQLALRFGHDLPASTILRADARPVHEAGGTEAQEIATAIASGLGYLRAADALGVNVSGTAASLRFAVGSGPDVLIETAKLRALRLCWARVLEASGAAPDQRAAHIHAFTSRRMMTRYDAWTNILRVATAAFAAAIGGADEITTYPFTDALGLPTPFARRVARNTQHVLLEECRLGHVDDPAGGAWFVEKLTRELAAKAWEIMQAIEARGGIVAALQDGYVQGIVAEARTRRQQQIATRRETITGVTDFPLLGAAMPEALKGDTHPPPGRSRSRPTEGNGCVSPFSGGPSLAPIRWAEPFESLRDQAEAQSKRPAVFFATLGALAAFGARAQFARNLFAAGGVASIGEEEEYATREEMIDAFRAADTPVAVICGTDATYAEDAENAAQRLKAAGADWVILAGKPGEHEQALRTAGVDQFTFTGQDALAELATLHTALGIAA